MADLSAFPITSRWKPKNSDIIQLYSLQTPNGQKVSVALEEMGLPYEAHRISFDGNEQKSAEFLSLNPNGKIPAIIDPNGPDSKPIGLFESGAILLYLADKTGQLIPANAIGRYETMQWVFFQMGGIGPMFGQFGHFFKYAADKVTNNSYPTERYRNESMRLLGVLEERLAKRQWIMGDLYTIADVAIFPWVRGLSVFYGGAEALELNSFPAVMDWVARAESRPASIRGLDVPVKD